MGHESHLVVVSVGRLSGSLIGGLSVSWGSSIIIRRGSGSFCVSIVEAVIVGSVHGTIVGLVVGIASRWCSGQFGHSCSIWVMDTDPCCME